MTWKFVIFPSLKREMINDTGEQEGVKKKTLNKSFIINTAISHKKNKNCPF